MHQNLKWLSQIEGISLKFKNQKQFLFRSRYIYSRQKTIPKISCDSPFKMPKYSNKRMSQLCSSLNSSAYLCRKYLIFLEGGGETPHITNRWSKKGDRTHDDLAFKGTVSSVPRYSFCHFAQCWIFTLEVFYLTIKSISTKNYTFLCFSNLNFFPSKSIITAIVLRLLIRSSNIVSGLDPDEGAGLGKRSKIVRKHFLGRALGKKNKNARKIGTA
jgi:hypothetical protein